VLHPVPNVGEGWYLVTAMLQPDTQRPPFLAILSSEQDGVSRTAVAGATEADDTAGVSVHDAFFRADEILQEDAGQICEELRLFSGFLRCAIEAGVAERATASMSKQESTDVRAALARTVNSLIGNRSRLRGLPSVDELRIALRLLNSLHPAA
jgi:hypothetical protein